MTPPRLILIRHAEPEIDPDIAPVHWALSSDGRRQATRLAQVLEPYGVDVIVTSQLPKAFETGRIIAENLFIPVKTVKGIQEHSRDTVGWLSSGDFERSIRECMARPEALVFGEESAAEARERFERAIHEVLESNPTETIAVVTHGTVLSLYVAGLDASDPFALWSRLQLPAFVVLSRPDLEVVELVDTLP